VSNVIDIVKRLYRLWDKQLALATGETRNELETKIEIMRLEKQINKLCEWRARMTPIVTDSFDGTPDKIIKKDDT
jgi:hypothetical protein